MRVRFEGTGREMDALSEVLPGGRGFKFDVGPTPDWDVIGSPDAVTILDGPHAGMVLRGRSEGTPETTWWTGAWPESMPNRPSRPMFGGTPMIEEADLLPEFVSVWGHGDDIAGYVDADLHEDGRFRPRNPDEAEEYMRVVKGELEEVFDTDGRLVGYFASGDHGFVEEAQKDQLVAEGYRLFRGRTPTPDGPSPIRGSGWLD